MSGSYTSVRHGGGGGLGTTTVLAAKVALASAAVAAVASFARLAVPQIVSVAGAFLWKLYLFAAVHVIIFVIWKLSDHKHFQAAAQHKDPWAPAPHPPPPAAEEVVSADVVKPKREFFSAPPPPGAEEVVSVDVVKPKREFFAAPTKYVVPPLEPEAWTEEISPDSGGGESCVTTESDEDASSAASAYVADARRSLAPAPQEHAVLQRELSLPPPPAVAATALDFDDDHNGDDDLDATWNAIMQKTRPAAAPASSPPAQPPLPSPPRPRIRDPSVGAAELSKRSEDFIKKIHNSFGREQ